MIIKRLTLHNFGIYAGTNTFAFENRKPVTLIGGLNGRGKTTFLEAVLLALYGSSSFIYEESRKATYGLYLRSLINQKDQSMASYVKMEFFMDAGENEGEYIIQRRWNGENKRIREEIIVWKDGIQDDFLSKNWGMFIENVLPSALSSFFFFDGEKIAELAVEKTNEKVQKSIKALLGIQVLDLLEKDLGKILKREKEEVEDQQALDELLRIKQQEKEQREKTSAAGKRLEEAKEQVQAVRRTLESLEMEYRAGGGDIFSSRQELFAESTRLESELEQLRKRKEELASGELPLLLVQELLEDTYKELKEERSAKEMRMANNKIYELFIKYKFQGAGNTDQIQEFMEFAQSQPEMKRKDDFLDMSEYALIQCGQLRGKGRQELLQELRDVSEADKKTRAKLRDVEQYLMVDIDETALNELYRRIVLLKKEIVEAEVELQEAEKSHEEEEKILQNLTQQRKALADRTVKVMETREKNQRRVKYIYQSMDIIEKYKIRLQKMKLGQLEQAITDCYHQLANKKNLIEWIEIDRETLEFTYLSKEREVIDKDALSAGEKQLMVIAILWGLAICSKKKLPVIIDTPLSRLDSEHRIALIQRYFPRASDQTIILSTDSEIDAKYYGILKEFVGDEFTLKYDDAVKTTTIEKGYFPEVMKNDH